MTRSISRSTYGRLRISAIIASPPRTGGILQTPYVRNKRADTMRGSSKPPHTSRRSKAERIASELAAMPENQASAAVIAKGDAALVLLKDDAGSDLWFQLQLRLGSLRLEWPDGDRADNVDRAKDHYRAVL